MLLVGLFLGAYLLGSVPFAVVLGRLKGINVLEQGSGNPGMTNVWRSLGPTFGIICFALDICKSLIPTLLARWLIASPIGPFDPQFLWFSVGVAAVIGHSASIFLKFKGGKGVSTALGVIIGSSPVVALLCFGFFLVIILVSQFVSLGSILGVASVIPFSLVVPNQSLQLLPLYGLLTVFVVYRHRKNLSRIRAGEENRMKKPESQSVRLIAASLIALGLITLGMTQFRLRSATPTELSRGT